MCSPITPATGSSAANRPDGDHERGGGLGLGRTGAMSQYTGGQYSLIRVVFGLCLLGYLLEKVPAAPWLYSDLGPFGDGQAQPIFGLIPNILALGGGPVVVRLLVAFAMLLTIPLCLGRFDRLAASAIWYILAALHWRNPLGSDPGLPFVGWLLLAHVLMPPGAYGSWSARHLADGAARWRMPRVLHAAVWSLLAGGYAVAGLAKLGGNPQAYSDALALAAHGGRVRVEILGELARALPQAAFPIIAAVVLVTELAFAPLALSARLRPVVWCWTLVVHQAVLGTAFLGQANLGMLMLHLFCFDPAWVKPRAAGTTDTVIYDGGCGLCHYFVRFLVAEDWSGSAFRFAARASAAAQPPAEGAVDREKLGDYVAVRTADGRLLVRSTAVLHVLHRLGGMWAVVADIAALVPRVFRDVAYGVVAGAGRRTCRVPTPATSDPAPEPGDQNRRL